MKWEITNLEVNHMELSKLTLKNLSKLIPKNLHNFKNLFKIWPWCRVMGLDTGEWSSPVSSVGAVEHDEHNRRTKQRSQSHRDTSFTQVQAVMCETLFPPYMVELFRYIFYFGGSSCWFIRF
jgi:hypothetical protein